jgi:hypothetical protein
MQSWGFSMNILGNFAEPFMVGASKYGHAQAALAFSISSLTKVSRFTSEAGTKPSCLPVIANPLKILNSCATSP